MKKASLVGAGVVGTGVVVAAQLPRTPEEAMTWTTALLDFISKAGMPGIILILTILVIGVVYYHEAIKLPRIHERYEARIRELEGQLERRSGADVAYRESVIVSLHKMISDSVRLATTIEMTLTSLVSKIERRDSNGNSQSPGRG